MTLTRLFTVAAVVAAVMPAGAQSPKVITAREGDVIVIENGDRVKVVRRRHAHVRAIFNSAERWLVLLLDHAERGGEAPDGRVDATRTFNDLSGEWPLGERWEGKAILDSYEGNGPTAFGFTAEGLIQLFPAGPRQNEYADPSAIARLTFRGSGGGMAQGRSFDEVEQRAVADAVRNARSGTSVNTVQTREGGTLTGGVSIGFGQLGQPVRVGGNIREPKKIKHVDPITPDLARSARIYGMVIIEASIGVDGTVTDAKLLRSIPLLDQAALDAVRQWIFEPTYLNGQPVPLIMTVTVNFAQ